jgi:hypothetical protein
MREAAMLQEAFRETADDVEPQHEI